MTDQKIMIACDTAVESFSSAHIVIMVEPLRYMASQFATVAGMETGMAGVRISNQLFKNI